jgi:hypothetical protein
MYETLKRYQYRESMAGCQRKKKKAWGLRGRNMNGGNRDLLLADRKK